MKKRELPRLTLNRETIRRLDDSALGGLIGGVEAPPSSQWICCPDPAYGQNAGVKQG